MKENIKLLAELNSILADEIIAFRAYNDAIELAFDWAEKQCLQVE